MSDDPRRDENEAALAAILLLLFHAFESEALSLANSAEIPPGFWGTMREKIRTAIRPAIHEIQLDASTRTASGLNMFLPARVISQIVDRSTDQQADRTARETVDRIRKKVAEEQEEAFASVGLGLFVAGLIDRGTPEMMSVGMTTEANTVAELKTVEQIQKILDYEQKQLTAIGKRLVAIGSRKIKIESRWQTQKDEKVCPICHPLHGRLLSRLKLVFRSGPPAHPRCRCFLSHEMKL